jgi:hypothetical protein
VNDKTGPSKPTTENGDKSPTSKPRTSGLEDKSREAQVIELNAAISILYHRICNSLNHLLSVVNYNDIPSDYYLGIRIIAISMNSLFSNLVDLKHSQHNEDVSVKLFVRDMYWQITLLENIQLMVSEIMEDVFAPFESDSKQEKFGKFLSEINEILARDTIEMNRALRILNTYADSSFIPSAIDLQRARKNGQEEIRKDCSKANKRAKRGSKKPRST